MAEHAHGARVLANQTHQNAYGGGLAGAVGANETHDGSCGQFQVDFVEAEVRIFLAHSLEMDGELVHTLSFVSRSAASRNMETSWSGVSPSRVPSCTT